MLVIQVWVAPLPPGSWVYPLPHCGWGLGGWTVASNPCVVELAFAAEEFILGLKQTLHLAALHSAEMH